MIKSFDSGKISALVVAAAFGLSGCEEGGSPAAGPTSETSASQSATPPPQTSAAAAPTASLDACTLLQRATIEKEFADFAPFQEGKREDSSDVRGCTWYNETETANDPRLQVDVAIRDRQGVKDAQDAGGGVSTGTLASGREAAQIPIPSTKGCIIALAVGPTSRVDITVGVHEKACDMASAMADLVDPKLPKG